MEAGHKCFIYSGELPKEDVKEWLDLQLLGRKHVDKYYSNIKQEYVYIPNAKYFTDLDNFYRNMMYVYDTEDYASDVEVFKAMEYMVKRELFGSNKLFVISLRFVDCDALHLFVDLNDCLLTFGSFLAVEWSTSNCYSDLSIVYLSHIDCIKPSQSFLRLSLLKLLKQI